MNKNQITITALAKNVDDDATIQEALASTFCDVAAHTEELAGGPGLPVLISYAALISKDLRVDASDTDDAHHAADCWNTVGNILKPRKGNLIANCARELEMRIKVHDGNIPAWKFYDVVIGNFDDLRDNTYTWRALADIVSMTADMPNGEGERQMFEAARKLIERLENE